MRVLLSQFVKTDHIALDNPARATSFVQELKAVVLGLGQFPYIYRLRPDIGSDARVAVHGQYVVLFRIDGDSVLVERVVQGNRNLSSLPKPPTAI